MGTHHLYCLLCRGLATTHPISISLFEPTTPPSCTAHTQCASRAPRRRRRFRTRRRRPPPRATGCSARPTSATASAGLLPAPSALTLPRSCVKCSPNLIVPRRRVHIERPVKQHRYPVGERKAIYPGVYGEVIREKEPKKLIMERKEENDVMMAAGQALEIVYDFWSTARPCACFSLVSWFHTSNVSQISK